MEAAAPQGWFYYYDPAATGRFTDHTTQRRWLRDLLGRTKVAVCNYARVDQPEVTRGSREIGYRYFEAAAAGAVMVGDPPAAPFDDLFDWPGALTAATAGTGQVVDIAAAALADPDRLHAISRRNVRESLLRHDWAYRWEDVLSTLGLGRPAALERRTADLALAAEAWT
jgi:hypothetical protein